MRTRQVLYGPMYTAHFFLLALLKCIQECYLSRKTMVGVVVGVDSNFVPFTTITVNDYYSIKNPEALIFQGFRDVWVRRFELPAS